MDTTKAARVLLFAGSVLLWAGPAAAGGLYRWIDPRGVVHYSDAPTDRRFRPIDLRTMTLSRRGYGLISFTRPSRYAGRAYDRLIVETAYHHGLPPALVKAVIATESNFNARAVSRKGALGLMQLMPETADMLGVDPLQPEENVDGGTRYLRGLWDRFGDLTHALAAYNAGPNAIERYRGMPPFPETQQYVRRVLSYYRHYHGELRP